MVHTTVVPALTVRTAGLKAKFSMLIAALLVAGDACVAVVEAAEADGVSTPDEPDEPADPEHETRRATMTRSMGNKYKPFFIV